MTGLKSGAGDDLWGDDEDKDSNKTNTQESSPKEPTPEGAESEKNESIATGQESGQDYIVRRALHNKSVQFERDERLTFFVHDDVIKGERELITEAESLFGRNIPKFDVREAVYRAALGNRQDVLAELRNMGYTPDEE